MWLPHFPLSSDIPFNPGQAFRKTEKMGSHGVFRNIRQLKTEIHES